jgi:hypothetical protein
MMHHQYQMKNQAQKELDFFSKHVIIMVNQCISMIETLPPGVALLTMIHHYHSSSIASSISSTLSLSTLQINDFILASQDLFWILEILQ